MNFVPGLTDQSIASGGVDEQVQSLLLFDAGLLVLSAAGGTLTADGSEQTLIRFDEPLGTFRPTTLFVDLDDMAGGDTTVIRIYYRFSDGGSLQLVTYATYTGADGGLANGLEAIAVDLYPNRHGFHATLEQTAGENADYPWEFFAEV